MPSLFPILLIACGLLAASNFILIRLPNARQTFDKVMPYSGILGVALLVLSILYLIKYMIPDLGVLLASVRGFIALATVVIAMLLGFLLGFGVVSKWIAGSSPAAIEKGEKFRAKLTLSQVPLGIAGVVLGIYTLI